MESRYVRLLKEWSDTLCELQVKNIGRDGVRGGIMCPVCSRMHGRSGDAVYPLLTMAAKTRNEKYLDAAVLLQRWSVCMNRPDGSFINEPTGCDWYGTTVFSVQSLAEALRHHGGLLDAKTRKAWKTQLVNACEFVHANIGMRYSHINYAIAAASALALGSMVLGCAKYRHRARSLAGECLTKLTPHDRLLHGEGWPLEKRSASGLTAIDIGYNVEESLGSLALYALAMKDAEALDASVALLDAHLPFMLPDGGWDNSFGTRSNKWTYWGSRTSDGCQIAYGLLADRNPAFAKAVEANTTLLAACTHNGILYGGPHLHRRGYLPCIHHTFCHAKALATLVNAGFDSKFPTIEALLPRQAERGLRIWTDLNTYFASVGGFRGTVSGYDWHTATTLNACGGAITMLWHERTGPLVSASTAVYTVEQEASNLQHMLETEDVPLTPLVELVADGVQFRSIYDDHARIRAEERADGVRFVVEGQLLDKSLNAPKAGMVLFSLEYLFTPDKVKISVTVRPSFPAGGIFFSLPVVSTGDEELTRSGNSAIIHKSSAKVRVRSTATLRCRGPWHQRIFNIVPGFEAVPFVFDLPSGREVTIELSVS